MKRNPVRLSAAWLVMAVPVWAALPATDTFTYSGSTEALTTYSPNWSYENGGDFNIGLVADIVSPNQTVSGGFARWNADTFANDQYSQITIGSLTLGSTYIGAAVRVATGAATGYLVTFNNTDVYVKKVVAGTEMSLSTTTLSLSAGDQIRLEVSGTSLSVKRNGAVISALSVTDNSIASGSAGIEGYGSGTAGNGISAWTGGNLSSGTAPTGPFVIR